MPNELPRRVARLNKQELDEMPANWSRRERGHHLRWLLIARGINPNRLYRVEYYPHRACWLFTQDGGAEPAPPSLPAPLSAETDEAFFAQVSIELRRTALSALASQRMLAGGKYELPPKPQELTPADLVQLLGDPGADSPPVRFDGEGGWQTE